MTTDTKVAERHDRRTGNADALVQQLSGSGEIRPRKRSGSSARKTPRVVGLRMEGGMVSARADGLDADVVTPAWREGWDVDYMRFIVHKWRDDDSEGGETWEVIDTLNYAQIALAQHKAQAQMIADALEFLAHRSAIDQFERAIKGAVSA